METKEIKNAFSGIFTGIQNSVGDTLTTEQKQALATHLGIDSATQMQIYFSPELLDSVVAGIIAKDDSQTLLNKTNAILNDPIIGSVIKGKLQEAQKLEMINAVITEIQSSITGVTAPAAPQAPAPEAEPEPKPEPVAAPKPATILVNNIDEEAGPSASPPAQVPLQAPSRLLTNPEPEIDLEAGICAPAPVVVAAAPVVAATGATAPAAVAPTVNPVTAPIVPAPPKPPIDISDTIAAIAAPIGNVGAMTPGYFTEKGTSDALDTVGNTVGNLFGMVKDGVKNSGPLGMLAVSSALVVGLGSCLFGKGDFGSFMKTMMFGVIAAIVGGNLLGIGQQQGMGHTSVDDDERNANLASNGIPPAAIADPRTRGNSVASPA